MRAMVIAMTMFAGLALTGTTFAQQSSAKADEDTVLIALLLLGRLAVVCVLVSLTAFIVLRIWQSTSLRRLGHRGQRYVGRIAYPWCVLSDWMDTRNRQAALPSSAGCRVCGYRPPAELSGAVFMGPGGLNKCPKCGTIYCNQHARRVGMGDIIFLNCPVCGESLERL